METRITLKELAASLNLSVSTVSKSLNDSTEISPITKRRVTELATLKRYVPNNMAQNLRGKKTKTLGIIIPNIFSDFFAEALSSMEEQSDKRGYNIIISFTNDSLEKEIECINKLIHRRVDGIIISPTLTESQFGSSTHLNKLSEYNIPLVLFDRILDNVACDKVGLNESLLAEEATLDLCKLGCKKIAYFSNISNTSIGNQRISGYSDAIKKIKGKKQIINFHKIDLKISLKHLIGTNSIDSILADDGLSSILIVKSILELGYRIPEDISMLNFSNGIFSHYLSPSLTAIDSKPIEQGKIAVDILIDRIEDRLSPELLDFRLEVSLVHRESTRRLVPSI
ncbi:LacI family DNA-binding transcriptional regulator [Gramella sp. AN32]|uniref:LacI family DNA-binding transcriptional regulator n=1 Tax=Christiangramia antarctica TaxID=2058158 RepID=A0ABW5X3T6_9FLAO|nr:LacI family DNA-binding transcriptional regulator [Gramella sp. AN32]MCM4157929.1 LacI family transcriptional regulator [Gramella sp. AN32]